MTYNPTLQPFFYPLIQIKKKKKRHSKYSHHAPPTAPGVAINVTIKGPHAGPNLLPACLSKQQHLTDDTAGEQGL